MRTAEEEKGGQGEMPTGTRKRVYGRWRLAVLTGAFLLILINPFLNYFLQLNFIQGWYQSFGLGSLWFVSPLEGLESLLIAVAYRHGDSGDDRSFSRPGLLFLGVPNKFYPRTVRQDEESRRTA